ncbi:MAG TPA: helix-turn-helix domain-containing protein [Armatimonadaceae bacterium]|nr:helix-turn-helix domain-containing protein [Armatimonadaceae bacterium]
MSGEGRQIHYHEFRGLALRHKGTAAVHVPLVMYADFIDARAQSVANHHHDFYSLYIVRRGRGTHVIDGQAYGVARGDVYAMRPEQTHHFEGCEDLVTDTLHFSPDIFDPATLDALSDTRGFHGLFVAEPYGRSAVEGRWLHLTPAAYANVAEAIDELRAEWLSGTPSGVLLTRGLFLRLLVRLAREYAASVEGSNRRSSGGAPPAAAHEATVAAAVHYLEEHFADAVRIEGVAAQVFLSPDRFTEVFAAVMGRTPRDYLRFLRIERARSLLATTDLPMTTVAAESGFGDPAYFTRAFRAATGQTPSDFRRTKTTPAKRP